MSITYELSSENTSICLSNGLFGGIADGVISAYYAEETCNDRFTDTGIDWFADRYY